MYPLDYPIKVQQKPPKQAVAEVSRVEMFGLRLSMKVVFLEYY